MEIAIRLWPLILGIFSLYFIITLVYKRLGIYNLKSAMFRSKGLELLILKYLIGIFLFGVIAYSALPDLRYLIHHIAVLRIPVLVLFIAACFLSAFLSIRAFKTNNSNSTGVICEYDNSVVAAYFIVRTVFLLSYEFFFRGIVLFSLLEVVPFVWAIIGATAFYVFIHCFDSKKEFIGSLPFGIVLCMIAYLSGGVWYAFFIHFILSTIYELQLFISLTEKSKLS